LGMRLHRKLMDGHMFINFKLASSTDRENLGEVEFLEHHESAELATDRDIKIIFTDGVISNIKVKNSYEEERSFGKKL